MEKKPLISIENLRKTYIMGDNEVKALQSASLNIYKNEYVALMGPSGSGKSTIIQMIERYYNPASGSVTVDGVPIADLNLRAFRQSVGYVG